MAGDVRGENLEGRKNNTYGKYIGKQPDDITYRQLNPHPDNQQTILDQFGANKFFTAGGIEKNPCRKK